MAFTEDLSAFFNTDEHAVSALLDGAAVVGIFDNGFVLTGGGLGMADTAPSFTLPTASVPASVRSKPFVYAGVTYVVAEHQADGAGVSILILARA